MSLRSILKMSALALALAASATAGITELTWAPNSEPDLAGYRLYYSTVSFRAGTGVWRSLAEVRADASVRVRLIPPGLQRVTVDNLALGRDYFFRLTAVNRQGEESDFNTDDAGRDEEATAPARAPDSDRHVFSPALADGVNDVIIFPAGAVRVQIKDVNGARLFDRSDASGADIAWDGRDDGGRWAASGFYVAQVTFADGGTRLQKILIVK